MSAIAVVIDGNAIMYRAYFATQARKEDAEAESQFGLTLSSIRATIDKILSLSGKVSYAAVTFDTSKGNFRKEKFVEYKSNRKPMPLPLLNNLGKIRQVFLDAGITIVDSPKNYEGDDAIATLSTIFSDCGVSTCVFSTDRDLLQLVSESVSVFLVRKSEWQKNTLDNFEKLNEGLKPYQIPFQKALSGDSSDNYKGLSGIGPVTSRNWLIKYGNIVNIYENIASLKPSHRQTLLDNRKDLDLFLELSSLVTNLDLSKDLKHYQYSGNNEIGGRFRQSGW